jgi:ligand-binding SRPBCC domain-containing protein
VPVFESRFEVDAPAEAVAAFYRDVRTLKRLTPAPLRIDHAEPPADGARAGFTLWMGPLPLRWRARYEGVTESEFTDVQEAGPLAYWRHTHSWRPLGPDRTEIIDHITYQHRPGVPGVPTRVFMSRPALRALFAFRRWRTRQILSG